MSLTPSFERETGQVILESLPGGVAGEASLIPVPGLDLAFDRADGRLCRVVVDTAGTGGSIAVGEQVAAMLTRLFGAEAPSVVSDIATEPGRGRALSPDPGLSGTLSSLARLDAARATSPVPPGSPWWAAEAAELAERAGLPARASAEAHHALAKLLRATGQHRHISASRTSRPGGSGRRRHHRGGRAGGRHPAAGSNRRAFRAAARRPVTDTRIRRGGRGRKP